jgi:myo-inositol-1(or 4)-monophosphatase
MIITSEFQEKAKSIVNQAATFIKENLSIVTSDDVIEKGTNSLVSYVDQQAEKILIDGLKDLLPDSGFITEEEMIEQSRSEYTWIIDPLDGTTNFLHSVPHFSVSVALFDGHNIILGIVQQVMSGEVFSAVKNQGAYLNGKKISVTDRKDFSDVLIGTGFPYKTEHTCDGHFMALKDVLAHTRGIRRIGSAALDLCYVACGRFGAFYEHHLNPYDIAAGALIVTEAGGVVSDYKGDDRWLFEGEILACAPQFRDRMLTVTSHF